MLFKKTLKAVSAAALWLGALISANSAMAVDFDMPQTATSNAPLTFSAEALGASTTGAYTVNHADMLTGTTTLGTLAGVINRTNDIYVRVDVGGVLRLRTTPGLSVGGDAATNQTTQPRDQHLIYLVEADDANTSASPIVLTLTEDIAVSGIGDGSLRMRAYDDIREAVGADDNPLFDKSVMLVKVDRSITVRAVPQTSTATVVSSFTQFMGAAGADHTLPIAGLSISIACHLDATGTLLQGDSDDDGTADAACGDNDDDSTTPPLGVHLSSVNVSLAAGTGSSLSVAGDSGFAFSKATTFSMMSDCSDGAAVVFPKLADGKPNLAGPAGGSVMPGTTFLCATVAPTNAERIEPGTYTATVNLVAANANMPFPPMGMADITVGTIEHDGTSVTIPYLTGYEMYTQRIIIVNRNKQPVSYRLTFHTEGDGTADPMYVEGMAAAGETTVRKVGEMVTLTNPTRASGTLDIVSSPRMVDVATTIVNNTMGDGSTDTVVLHLGKRDGNN